MPLSSKPRKGLVNLAETYELVELKPFNLLRALEKALMKAYTTSKPSLTRQSEAPTPQTVPKK